MRGKLWFLGGLAAGFVLGTRAGREKYEELVRTVQKVKDSPTVQEAAGVVQEQATKLYSESRSKVSDKLAHTRFAETKLGERLIGSPGASPDPTMSAPVIERSEPLDDTVVIGRTSDASGPSTTTGTRSSGL